MGELTVAAGATGRVYEVGEGGVRAVAVLVESRRLPVDDRGMRLVVEGRTIEAGDLALTGDPVMTGDGRRLSWRLAGPGVDVEVVAEAEAGAPVVRTRLALSGSGRLQAVDVERWGDPVVQRPPGSDAQPIGQPLWGQGLFAGLEHPGAENVVEPDGSARMGLPVDVRLGSIPYVMPPVAVGGAAPGQERSAFWDELDRLRPHPPRMVVLANNWYQLGAVGRMDEGTVRAELEGFGEVAERHGLPLDWYCLDDPWDGEWTSAHGLWGRLAPGRFPGGLTALQGAADGRVGGIGLWLSPWGGYFDRHDARVAWSRSHGYEIQDGDCACLCPAGEEYRRHLADTMGAWTEAGVGYWKLDGVQFNCAEPHHGHAVGSGGRTTQMDRFADLLDGVRAVDPNVVLTFTTGSNPSPWWLRHADFLWRGGLDDDAPEEYGGGRQDRFATYIDTCLDALRHTAVPVSAIVTFSVVANQVRAYRDEGGDPQAWERHCWFLAGRGTHHHDLYVAPDSLSEPEWAALARALTWARANQAVLARSRMVGGRPQAGEPYGFLSASGKQAILCVRNPGGREAALTLTAQELGGTVQDLEPVWGRAAVHRLADPPERSGRPGRPERDRGRVPGLPILEVELEPFEVVVVTGRWRPGTPGGPRGSPTAPSAGRESPGPTL